MKFSDKLWDVLSEARNRRGGKLPEADWRRLVDETYLGYKKANKKPAVTKMTREQLITYLKEDASLKALSIEAEFSACERWCKVKGKPCSVMRLINWVNNAATRHAIANPQAPQSQKRYDGPVGWRIIAKEMFPAATIDFDSTSAWTNLPPSVQAQIYAKCKERGAA